MDLLKGLRDQVSPGKDKVGPGLVSRPCSCSSLCRTCAMTMASAMVNVLPMPTSFVSTAQRSEGLP